MKLNPKVLVFVPLLLAAPSLVAQRPSSNPRTNPAPAPVSRPAPAPAPAPVSRPAPAVQAPVSRPAPAPVSRPAPVVQAPVSRPAPVVQRPVITQPAPIARPQPTARPPVVTPAPVTQTPVVTRPSVTTRPSPSRSNTSAQSSPVRPAPTPVVTSSPNPTYPTATLPTASPVTPHYAGRPAPTTSTAPTPVGGPVTSVGGTSNLPPVRSTARPAPTNVEPSPRNLYDRSNRRAEPVAVRPVDPRYTNGTRPYRPADVSATRGSTATTTARPIATPRPAADTRYSTVASPRPAVVANPRPVRATTNAVANRPIRGSIVSAIGNPAVRANPRGSSLIGGVHSSWYGVWSDPCYTGAWHVQPSCWAMHFGSGCHGFGLSLWLPWYSCCYDGWVHHYRSCWWDTWSTPYYWSGCSSWWYPSTVYYPSYLYVPSETVIVERTVVETPAEAPAAAPAPAPEKTVLVADSKTAKAGSPEALDLAKKYVELGDFYFRENRFDDALDAYARARTYAPDDASLHFVLADAAFATGDFQFAAFLIAEGLRIDPSLASAKVDKKTFYGDPVQFDVQMQKLDDYLAEKPYDASAHLVRGYNLAFSERPAAAIAAFRRVLEIAPDHRAARIFLDVLAPEPAAEPVIR